MDGGRVGIRWAIEAADHSPKIVMRWTEVGGPQPTVPERKGFGMEMIERQLGYELGGSASIEYPPDGLTATLTIPVDPDGDFDGAASGGHVPSTSAEA